MLWFRALAGSVGITATRGSGRAECMCACVCVCVCVSRVLSARAKTSEVAIFRRSLRLEIANEA